MSETAAVKKLVEVELENLNSIALILNLNVVY